MLVNFPFSVSPRTLCNLVSAEVLLKSCNTDLLLTGTVFAGSCVVVPRYINWKTFQDILCLSTLKKL